MNLEVLGNLDVTKDNISELLNGNKYEVTLILVRKMDRSGVYWRVAVYV
jgi:hypothetical protein